MANYSEIPLTDESISRMANAKCYGYGTGESHRRDIENAGGQIGYDGFKDPRPNEKGGILASRIFINDQTKVVQGINFSKNGKFCCSYTGMDYNDIKKNNIEDCEMKKEQSQSNSGVQYDKYGVEIKDTRSTNPIQTRNNEIKRY